MSKSLRILTIAILPPLVGGCVLPGYPVSPYGRQATVYPIAAPGVSGELIAANPDSLWLMRDSILQAFRSADIQRLSVQRHPYNGKRTMILMAIAGAGTGVAMSVACSRYNALENESNTDCNGVFPGFFVAFLVPGSIFALVNERSSKLRLTSRDTETLRMYSRFPQGLPDTLRVLRK